MSTEKSTRLPPVISVDGPSGVGKGTVSRWLAARLGWNRLDSGALYRLAALATQAQGVDANDETTVAAVCAELDADFATDEQGRERVTLAGADVTRQLRLETTGNLASRISAHPAVRQALLKRQHDFRQPPGLVADGRDMGTVLFPDAILKFFLDASIECRARRRWRQLSNTGIQVKIDGLCAEVADRDERDRNRSVSPLRAADDAVTIDTTELSVVAVEAQVAALLAKRGLV